MIVTIKLYLWEMKECKEIVMTCFIYFLFFYLFIILNTKTVKVGICSLKGKRKMICGCFSRILFIPQWSLSDNKTHVCQESEKKKEREGDIYFRK